jgi:hypothetical protein
MLSNGYFSSPMSHQSKRRGIRADRLISRSLHASLFVFAVFLVIVDRYSFTSIGTYVIACPVTLTLIVHTSNATIGRLSENLMNYAINIPGVRYFCVLARGVPHPPGIPVVQTTCVDSKGGVTGLLCRNTQVYQYFTNHTELGPWLFRAMDDTLVNVPNLLNLVAKLSQVYRPAEEFVFRGFLNDEHGDPIFLGGGSGWLMSRAFVALHGLKRYSLRWNVPRALHFQDDTTETIIVRHVLPNISAWSDPLWSERCLNCQGSRWRQGDFSTLERCPDTQTYPMNALVSFHPGTDPQSKIAGKMVGWYPEDVRFYHPVKTGAISVCRGTGPRDGPTVGVLRAQALHVTIDMLNINEPCSVAGVWLV